MMKNRMRRNKTAARLAGPLVAVSLALAGCSGGFNNNFFNGDTGTFFSSDQPVGNGVGRDFVQLNNGVPVRLGIELTPAALTGLPGVPHDVPAAVFIAPMPSKTHGTPFKSAIVVYSSGHDVPNVQKAESAHFHATFLIRPLQTTEPPFFSENALVVPNQVPQDHIRVVDAANPNGVIVPGIGVTYDDPSEPSGFPGLQTLGQNYFFFDGRMNAIALGPTVAFLQSKQTSSQPIKQPQVYPIEGYYPTRWQVRFDATRNVHVIELTDFVIAHNVVPLAPIG